MGALLNDGVFGLDKVPTCLPARTPGPLGINDHADPNVTAFVGDTPGPLGIRDCGDPTLYTMGACLDRRHQFPRSYSLSESRDNRTLSNGSLDLEQAQTMALQITVHFEGGGYAALADNTDRQGMSYGLIQWNFGQNTLGPLLQKMMAADPIAFAQAFENENDYEGLKGAVLSCSKDEQLTWARNIINNNRAAWKKAFRNLASVDTFQKIQREEAIRNYHPLVLSAVKRLRGVVPELFEIVLFKSYAALFDLCVQQHGIGNAMEEIKRAAFLKEPHSQLDAMIIVVTERARKARSQYQSDCVSRRMGILTGKSFLCTDCGVHAERKNPHFEFVATHGDKYVLHI